MAAVAVGDVMVVPLLEGTSKVPPDSFPVADFARQADLLDRDGRVHLPIGVLLIGTQRETVLIDAGLGHAGWLADGGKFFARPAVRFGSADWEEFMVPEKPRPCPLQIPHPE